MRILRNKEYPHLQVVIDGKAMTSTDICWNCGLKERHHGPDAIMNAVISDGPKAFREAHKDCKPSGKALHYSPDAARAI